jgi:nuclear transport factor 2 (NTF2) superfamily protein
VPSFDEYRKRAEQAERAAENARDPQAKQLLKNSAQRWRQLAELVAGRTNVQKLPENIVSDRQETPDKDSTQERKIERIKARDSST